MPRFFVMIGNSTTERSDMSDPKQIKDAINEVARTLAINTLMEHLNITHQEACDRFYRSDKSKSAELINTLRVGVGSTVVMIPQKDGSVVMSFESLEEKIARSV